jgi:hypothetical protein
MESSESGHCSHSPWFHMASLGYSAVPKRRLVISRQLGSHALQEDREVLMLNRVLEVRTCGWVDGESAESGGDGELVGAGHHFIFFAFNFFVFFLAACNLSL